MYKLVAKDMELLPTRTCGRKNWSRDTPCYYEPL